MRSKPPGNGSHVRVGGYDLWADRAGTGRPTVVFLPGAGSFGMDFLLAHEIIAKRTTSVIYDRASTGWSEDTPLPRTADSVIDELLTLLKQLSVHGPLIPVGHSLGGLYAQRLLQCVPERIAGLVLIDAIHEDYDNYMPEHLRLSTLYADAANATPPEPNAELITLARAQLEPAFVDWPELARGAVLDRHLDPSRILAGFYEGTNILDELESLREGGPRRAIPMSVLTAGGTDDLQRAYTDPEDLRAQMEGTERLARHLAAAAKPGTQRTVPDVSHASLPMRRPDAVIEAVDSILDASQH